MRKVAVAVALMTIGLIGPLAGHAHADTVSDEQRFVQKINELRASKGLSQLVVDSGLTGIARDWSQNMASVGDISHNPNLKGLVASLWTKLGENVGMGPSVDSLFVAFVNSPHHYDNLVDPAWTHVGVGVVYAGNTIFTSHQFMQVRGGAAPSTPRVTAPPTTRTTRTTISRPVVPAAPKPAATTTTVPPPPPPPPPPEVPERVRQVMEVLRGFDPNG